MLVVELDGIRTEFPVPSPTPGRAANVRRPSCAGTETNLGRGFENVARHRGDNPVLITEGNWVSYASLLRAANQVAAFLKCTPQFASSPNVILFMENCAEYLAGFYGTLLAGGVVVPLPENTEGRRLTEIIEATGAEIVLTNSRQHLRRSDLAAWKSQYIELSAAESAVVRSSASQDDLAVIMFTSGTTTDPKGVMLSHGNLLANADSILAVLPITERDRALALLPFCHAYGNSVLQTHVLSGATLVIDGSPWFPNSIIDALERHQVTSLAGVPEVFYSLLICSDLGKRKLPSLRYMTVAGGAIDSAKALNIAAAISPAEFYVMYGQTEATARLACLKPDRLSRQPDSAGKSVPGVEIAVRDEFGRAVPTGEEGELWARGANIMLGYWNDADATGRKIQNGWLRTGDLAAIDDEGFIYLKGRRDEQIKVYGLKVSPRDIERTLLRRFSTAEIAVVPFHVRGTAKLALFLACGRENPSVDRIRRCCAEVLARHELPCYVEVLPKLPKTASLKTDRRQLALHAAVQVDKQTTNFNSNWPVLPRSGSPCAAAN